MIAATGSVVAVYLFDAAVALLFVVALFFVHTVVDAPRSTATSLEDLGAGFGFVWNHPVILGALSLDMFAVLLGGVTALLPIFAKDVLQVGPWGLGLLRSAPAVGSLVMSLVLTRWAIHGRTGPKLFAAVGVYGLATLAFGLSTELAWSLAALARQRP